MAQSLVAIAPADVRQYWERIKEGLAVVRKRGPVNWIDEDVYANLKAGSAQLFITEDTFVICYPERMHDGMSLHIWIAYSTHGNAVETYEPQLIEIAKGFGAIRLKCESARNWEPKGYIPVSTIYYKDI